MKHSYKSALLSAELGMVPELDIHGLEVADAIYQMELFLHSVQLANTEAVRIVHGKGTGKLRRAVHDWLTEEQKKKNLVIAFSSSNQPNQETAITVVAIRSLR